MPSAGRIRGQEITISILVDGVLQTRIDSIQSCDLEFEMNLMQEGYLGETFDRVDSVYNVISIKLSGHMNSQAYLELCDAIVARAQNRAGAAIQFDIVGSFRFANGDFPSIAIPDVHFDTMPLQIGGRGEHVTFSLDGKASSYQVIL